jgi:hypothetical protein
MVKNGRKIAAAIALVVGISLFAGIPVTASATSPYPDTLYAGQSLTPATATSSAGSFLMSANGEYELNFGYNAPSGTFNGSIVMQLLEYEGVAGANPWMLYGPGTAQATATMQTDGNFVIYSQPGVELWSTRTAGTGTSNRFVLRDDGAFVVMTSAGKVVWSSHSHREIIGSGRTLMPGEYIAHTWPSRVPPTTITMQQDGDLVVRFQGAALWASNTNVKGSYLQMDPDGGLVIYTPSGHAVWTSGTSGRLASSSDGTPWVDANAYGHFVVSFTPGSGGGAGQYAVFDSARLPGETGRTSGGDLELMTPGSVLHTGQSLISANGYRLTMQSNGNLVQRNAAGTIRWQSHTAGHPGALLYFRRNGGAGYLVIKWRTQVLWSAGKATNDYWTSTVNFAMQSDGNIVARGVKGQVIWSSHTPA